MRAEPDGVRAWIKESLVSDIKTELARLMTSNVISHKDLHSLVGKLGHASGLLIIMRPSWTPYGPLCTPMITRVPRAIRYGQSK